MKRGRATKSRCWANTFRWKRRSNAPPAAPASSSARWVSSTCRALGKHISMEAAFQCTTCGACEFQCPVGIQHLPVIIGLRRGAVNTGKWEDDYGGKMFLAMERTGNSLGFASSERTKFIEKNELPIFDGTQEYCLWLGCMGSYDPQGREIVLSLGLPCPYPK